MYIIDVLALSVKLPSGKAFAVNVGKNEGSIYATTLYKTVRGCNVLCGDGEPCGSIQILESNYVQCEVNSLNPQFFKTKYDMYVTQLNGEC